MNLLLGAIGELNNELPLRIAEEVESCFIEQKNIFKDIVLKETDLLRSQVGQKLTDLTSYNASQLQQSRNELDQLAL